MRAKKKGYVYILSNKPWSVLYTGVISDVKDRVWRHRNGEGSAFIRKYKVKYFMYIEEHDTMLRAIEREKQIKGWKRAWKLELVRMINPELRDFWHDL